MPPSSSAMDWFVLLVGAIILEAQLSSSMKHLPANITGVLLEFDQPNQSQVYSTLCQISTTHSAIIDFKRVYLVLNEMHCKRIHQCYIIDYCCRHLMQFVQVQMCLIVFLLFCLIV